MIASSLLMTLTLFTFSFRFCRRSMISSRVIFPPFGRESMARPSIFRDVLLTQKEWLISQPLRNIIYSRDIGTATSDHPLKCRLINKRPLFEGRALISFYDRYRLKVQIQRAIKLKLPLLSCAPPPFFRRATGNSRPFSYSITYGMISYSVILYQLHRCNSCCQYPTDRISRIFR